MLGGAFQGPQHGGAAGAVQRGFCTLGILRLGTIRPASSGLASFGFISAVRKFLGGVLPLGVVQPQAGQLHHDGKHRGGHHLLPHACAHALGGAGHGAGLGHRVVKTAGRLEVSASRSGRVSRAHPLLISGEGAQQGQFLSLRTQFLSKVAGQAPVAAHGFQAPGAEQRSGVAAGHPRGAHDGALVDSAQTHPQVGQSGHVLAVSGVLEEEFLHAPVEFLGERAQGVGQVRPGVVVGHGKAVELVEGFAVVVHHRAGARGPGDAESIGSHAGPAVHLAGLAQ